jgi:hypothetical protein
MSDTSRIDWDHLRFWLHREARRLASDGAPDPMKIADELGAEVKLASRSPQSGLLSAENGKYVITIQSGDRQINPRGRFTLAHELAHLLLLKEKGYRPILFKDSKSYYKMEELCNFFAGKLLVPERVFDEVSIVDLDDVMSAVLKLSAVCGVSKVVAAKEMADAFDGVGYMGLTPTDPDAEGRARWRVDWSCGLCESLFNYRRPKKIGCRDPLFSHLSVVDQSGRNYVKFRMNDEFSGVVHWFHKSKFALLGIAKLSWPRE